MRWYVIALLVTLNGGCFSHAIIPPREEPAPRVPRLSLSPPPPEPGQGRLAIDSDPSAVVNEILAQESGTMTAGTTYGTYQTERTRPVCTAPCVVNIPYGDHLLRFSDDNHEGVMRVRVGDKPLVLNVNVGRSEYYPDRFSKGLIRTIMVAFGASTALTGAASLTSDTGDTTSVTLLVVGGALLGAALLWDPGPDTVTQKPSGLQWEPANGVIYRR